MCQSIPIESLSLIIGGIMRASEFIHWLNRTDIGLSVNPSERDYTHYTPRMLGKRMRYEHQTALRKEKKDENKNARQSKRKVINKSSL